MPELSDFNGKPIERGDYVHTSGDAYVVANIFNDGSLHYYPSGQTFGPGELPPELSQDFSSKLIRLTNQKKIYLLEVDGIPLKPPKPEPFVCNHKVLRR